MNCAHAPILKNRIKRGLAADFVSGGKVVYLKLIFYGGGTKKLLIAITNGH